MLKFLQNIVFIFLFSLAACKRGDAHKTELTARADSLMTIASQMARQLNQIDTALLDRAVDRYTYHKQFLESALKDTISKEQADQLQNFQMSGRFLSDFAPARRELLAQLKQVSAQLSALRSDSENGANLQVVAGHLSRESAHLSVIVAGAERTLGQYHKTMEQFRMVLPAIEKQIRSLNSGRLPVVVRDTLAL